ncbi:MAG: D-glycero-alpha-D-manno-heptose-1,7-bisphosphate 7-phosphatase [Thermoplasmata archaeon]
MPNPGPVPALFVDRDGTLMVDLHYLAEADRLEIYRGVSEALSLARAHGFRIVCVTNQSGIERGLATDEDVRRVHARLHERLRANGAEVDAFYSCPHRPERKCNCRKPGTELFERAQRDLNLDIARSAIVGDRWLDIEAGRRLGIPTALVPPPGHEAEIEAELHEHGAVPDIRARTFRAAVMRVLARG